MNKLEYADYGNALARETHGLAEAIRSAGPAAEINTCPGWNAAKLARHLGTIQRWAEAIVRTRSTERVNSRELDLGLPSDDNGYPEWLESGARSLTDALSAADPNTPVWVWGADPRIRFWARRIAMEAAVHRVDAELALGRQPIIDPALAADGIDEFLENLPKAASFAPKVAELRGNGESLHFHATDGDGEWMIQLTPEGFSWEHGHGKGSVAVRGTAGDLLLLLYGRLQPDDVRFQCFGDTDLLHRWLSQSAI